MARVVVLAQRVPFPPNKGEKLRTFHQIEGLVQSGHNVKVLAPVENEVDFEQAKNLAAHFDIDVICQALPHKFMRLSSALLSNKSFSEANFYSVKLSQALSQAIKDADVLLLTASSLAPYVFNLPAECKQNIRLLMDFMDVDSDKWLQYAKQSPWPKSIVYKREAKKVRALEALTAEEFSTCFLIAEAEVNIFRNSVSHAGNLKVLGNGIDQSLFNPSQEKPANTLHFLFSGVMDYKPNIDAVLWFVEYCWGDIKAQVEAPKLTIAGMNPVAEISKLSADSTIEVTGFVDDIKPYFDRASIFIAPFQIARGVQNKVLQAMACALPVVSTELGAEGIACEHEVDIVIAHNAKAFTAWALTLAKSPTMREKIGQRALKTIEDNYAWHSVLQPLIDSIEA